MSNFISTTADIIILYIKDKFCLSDRIPSNSSHTYFTLTNHTFLVSGWLQDYQFWDQRCNTRPDAGHWTLNTWLKVQLTFYRRYLYKFAWSTTFKLNIYIYYIWGNYYIGCILPIHIHLSSVNGQSFYIIVNNSSKPTNYTPRNVPTLRKARNLFSKADLTEQSVMSLGRTLWILYFYTIFVNLYKYKITLCSDLDTWTYSMVLVVTLNNGINWNTSQCDILMMC